MKIYNIHLNYPQCNTTHDVLQILERKAILVLLKAEGHLCYFSSRGDLFLPTGRVIIVHGSTHRPSLPMDPRAWLSSR